MRTTSRPALGVGFLVAGCVLGLASASGGFYPVSWNVGALVAAWIALLALLFDGAPLGRHAMALLEAVILLTAWTALSAIWSESVSSSYVEFERMLLYALAVTAALALGRHLTLERVAAGVLIASEGICVWNLLTRWGETVTGREAEPITYANGLALVATIGALLAVGFAVAGRPVVLVALAPLLPVLVLSRSNGAWAALLGGLVVLALLRSELHGRNVLLAGAIVASAFFGLAVLIARGHERGVYWPVALHEIAAHPVLGSGAGTYGTWFLRLRSQPFQTLDAHSLYLETLAELGPLGLAALLALLAVPLAAAGRLRNRPLAPAAAGAVAAYALGAGIDFDWELAAVTLPVLLLGAALVAADGERPSLSVRARTAAAIVVAGAGAAAALALAGNAPLAAAGDSLAAGRPRAAETEARRAERYLPWSPEPLLALGEARRALGDPAGARDAFERAVRRNPSDWSAWLRLAEVSTGEPRRRALARAARLNPLYFASS